MMEDTSDSEANNISQSQESEDGGDRDGVGSPRRGGQAEVGIVEEITLQNFMCHKHLNLQFGPNINFIVGPNGSK